MTSRTPDLVAPRTARAAGIAGLVFAALFTSAFALLRVGAPPDGAVAFAAWWLASRDRITAGTYIVPFAGMAFIWFVAAVRRRIGHAEGLFFATAFLGSALVFVAMFFATGAASGAILAASALQNGAEMRAVAVVGHALAYALFFGFAVKMAAMFMLAVASIGRGSEALPRWLVLLTIVLAVASLIGNTFLEVIALIFPAWVVVVSVLLIGSGTGMNQPAPGDASPGG